MILDSSMVEHSAVNRRVVGSSPTRGVKPVNVKVYRFFSASETAAGTTKKAGKRLQIYSAAFSLSLVRLAAHVSQGCKSQIRPVVGRI